MKTLAIIKIGGNIIDDEAALAKFIDDFAGIGGAKLLVHGGGRLATDLSERLGLKTHMHNGRRITDAETLKIACMVYAGWINKSIVAKLNAKGQSAIGLCGADLFAVPSVKRPATPVDFGFVGDVAVNNINVQQFAHFVDENICPVIAPITSDAGGQLLNTNADTIASALASALSAIYQVKLIYCFEKNGVLHNSEVIKCISRDEFVALKEKEIISGGMIPKLENAFSAAGTGVSQVMIGHAANIHALIQNHGGTCITI